MLSRVLFVRLDCGGRTEPLDPETAHASAPTSTATLTLTGAVSVDTIHFKTTTGFLISFLISVFNMMM